MDKTTQFDLSSISWLAILLVVVECSLIIFGILRMRKLVQTYRASRRKGLDALQSLEFALREVFKSRFLAELLLFELRLLFNAFAGWFKTRSTVENEFDYFKKSGYPAFLAGILVFCLMELVIVHVVLMNWMPLLAWILLGLSLYGCIWLVGDYNLLRLGRLSVESKQLRLEMGLRWKADIPFSNILKVETAEQLPDCEGALHTQINLLRSANTRIFFRRPQRFRTVFGIVKNSMIWDVYLHENEAFKVVMHDLVGGFSDPPVKEPKKAAPPPKKLPPDPRVEALITAIRFGSLHTAKVLASQNLAWESCQVDPIAVALEHGQRELADYLKHQKEKQATVVSVGITGENSADH